MAMKTWVSFAVLLSTVQLAHAAEGVAPGSVTPPPAPAATIAGAVPAAGVSLQDGRPQPFEPLAQRIASAGAMPRGFVEKILRKWVTKELIVYRKDAGLYRWSWRESSRARSPLQKSPPLP